MSSAADRRAERDRKQATAEAIKHFDRHTKGRVMTRSYKQTCRARIIAAPRPMAAAKSIVRDLPRTTAALDAVRFDLSAGTEAIARANREIRENWPWLTAGAQEVESQAAELSRDLLLGKITQAQFNARCAELKNPEWFARYHPDRSIQQQPQVSKLPAHMKAIRK
jgi:hypothetical protein